MLILCCLLHLLQYDSALAAPVKNLTALNTDIAPGWVAGPSGRGTWDLLYSCTFTIFLCVYTAIHLDVPPEETSFRFWLRKTKWVFIAILAPEIVVYTAFEQWFLSRKFLKDLNKIVDESADEKSKGWARAYDVKCRFDMVYAQYALMGGFAADIRHIHNAITERVTITTEGILFLARHGCFCQIKKDDIQDKSKADMLAKGLVCVQVLWVAGQAIERKVAGYPITLLEVHTLVHVVCAIIMYLLWIKKPLNVRDPTMIDFRDASDVLSFMVELSRQEPHYNLASLTERPGFRYTTPDGDATRLKEPNIVWYKDLSMGLVQLEIHNPEKRLEVDSPLESTSQSPIRILTLYSNTYKDADGVTHYYAIGTKPQTEYKPTSDVGIFTKMVTGQASSLGYGPSILEWQNITKSLVENIAIYRDNTTVVWLSEKDTLRLNSTAEFLAKIKASATGVPTASIDSQDKIIARALANVYVSYTGVEISGILLMRRSLNFKGDIFKNLKWKTSYLVTAMTLIPAAYGCVHIGALGLTFPSPIERLLWEISCYYLIAVAIAFGILVLFAYADNAIDERWRVDVFGSAWDVIFDRKVFMKVLGAVIFWSILLSISLLYVGARLYIVVESFISLRYVPVGVYETPDVNFMNYIPHL